MRVVLYPADNHGCGFFRMVWPGEALAAAGHDVTVKPPAERDITVIVRDETVHEVRVDPGTDVVVFQRLTHAWMAQAVSVLRRKGVAVVVDIDDDLNRIHPANPAYASMHPRNVGGDGQGGQARHSWHHLARACRDATLVTVSTPALLDVYARHGRGRVLPNYLPEIYYGVPHEDSEIIGWPASLHSHPDDPSSVGGAVARLCGTQGAFRVVGDPTGSGEAFGLPYVPRGHDTDVFGWPAAVAELGIGIAPLADTRFNAAKSWLKPLEMSALGVPWVASPRAEYLRLHARGAGLLADSPRRWYQKLNQLRASAQLRADLAGEGRRVAEGLRLVNHAHRWWEAWSAARELQSAERSGPVTTGAGRAWARTHAQ